MTAEPTLTQTARLSRVWHAAIAAVVLAALIIQLVLIISGSGGDVNAEEGTPAVSTGTRLVRFFSYFTVQSNILVLISVAGLALASDRDGRVWRVLRLDALLGIVITGVVYAVVLAGLVHHVGIEVWINAGFHYFAPWATLLGWLLFGPRPRVDWQTVYWSALWPVLWIGYTLIHGAATDWYPYPFLDVTELGYPTVLRNIAFVLVIAAGLTLLFRLLDGRLRATRR